MRRFTAPLRWRFRALALGACAVCVLLAASPAGAQFPIAESFRNANGGSWTLLGDARFTSGDGDPDGEGWLRLTGPNPYEAGSAILDAAFSSTTSVVVSFVYAMHGGSVPDADGLAFYLIDGSTPAPTLGAGGGGLGYASEYASCTGNSAVQVAGVTNGYLGVGFDAYGDFSDCWWGRGGPGQQPDAVVIRGSGNRFDGNAFRYLTGTRIGAAPFSRSISTAGRAEPRPVRISIVNGVVTVEMDFGSGHEVVVAPYAVMTATGQAPLPATFKMGFSGSTGSLSNQHEIRDLLVTAPARLTLGHAATPATIEVGETVTYTVTVANDDRNVVNGIAFSDQVPPAIGGVTWSAVAAGGATVSSASGNGNAIATRIDLPRNASVTFTVTGTASASAAGTTLQHAATIEPPPSISNLGEVSATATVAVSRMATATFLASAASPSSFGEPLTFTAFVSPAGAGSGTPTGSVTFLDGETALGTATLAGGVGVIQLPWLGIGSHTIRAVYGGDPRFAGGEGAMQLEIAHGERCLVQSDCLGGQTCVRETRRGEFGLCETPSSVAPGLGCSSTGTGSLSALALAALALSTRRRAAAKR